LLALAVEGALALLQHALTPRGLRAVADKSDMGTIGQATSAAATA
jgi:hypothetical protein